MLTTLKNIFRGNNFISKIILINAIIFVVYTIIAQFSPAFVAFVSNWFSLSASLSKFILLPNSSRQSLMVEPCPLLILLYRKWEIVKLCPSPIHVGGAVLGFLYIRQLSKGQDWALAFHQKIEQAQKLFEKKPKLRVVPNDYGAKKANTTGSKKTAGTDNETQAKTDAILDKISKSIQRYKKNSFNSKY